MQITTRFALEPLRLALAQRWPSVPTGGDLRPAGVLVPLYRRGTAWHVLLCRRADSVAEHQREVAFPGGRLEKGDADLTACALREAWEEAGIQADQVAVLGQLDPVATRTGYLVQPTVGTLPDGYPFVANEDEVAELLEVPIDWLLSADALRHEARLGQDGAVERRCTFAFESNLVYGATAAMLTQLLDLYRVAAGTTDPMEVSG